MPRHPFIVGGQYRGYSGTYEVLDIADKRISIRYTDGRTTTGDLEIRARIHKDIIATARANHPYQSAQYFRTLGFLTRYGEFHAEVPPQSREPFQKKYQMVTGYRPVLHKDGYFPIDVATNYDKWGAELRINFPTRDNLDFPPAVQPRTGAAAETLRINKNDYWWQLVHVGFRLGTRHDVEQIQASVPSDLVAAFDDGRRF